MLANMNIIEYLKDPKKRSIMLLAFYFVFFFIVILMINQSESKYESKTNNKNAEVTEIEEKQNEEENIDNYDYQIIINDLGNNVVFDGTYIDHTTLFNYNNNIYYLNNNNLYIIDNTTYYSATIPYNINKIFSINELIKDSNLEYTKEYNDGRIEKNYIIDSNEFYKYYYDTNSNYIDNNINIIVNEINNQLSSININLNSLDINIKSIEIKYSNMNQIKNFDFDINNYTYKE